MAIYPSSTLFPPTFPGLVTRRMSGPLLASEDLRPSDTLYPSIKVTIGLLPSPTLLPSDRLLPSLGFGNIVEAVVTITGQAPVQLVANVLVGSAFHVGGRGVFIAVAGSVPVNGSVEIDGSSLVRVAQPSLGPLPSLTTLPSLRLLPSLDNEPPALQEGEAHLFGGFRVRLDGRTLVNSGAGIIGTTQTRMGETVVLVSDSAHIEGATQWLLDTRQVDFVVHVVSTAELKVTNPNRLLKASAKVKGTGQLIVEHPQGMRAAHKTMYEAGISE